MTLPTPQPLLAVRYLRIESTCRGEFPAPVGECGNGKALAARAIDDLLPPGERRACGASSLGGGRRLIGTKGEA